MDHLLWSKLPDALLELVLSSLPVVCRFRTVCKRWNKLFCSPEFGKLCVVSAARNANERASLVLEQQGFRPFSSSRETSSKWSVLDLKKKKWYNLKHDLRRCSHLSDMDGGFICTAVGSSNESRFRFLIMFNPFGGATKVIPDLPSIDVNDGVMVHGTQGYSVEDANLKLIVDNNSSTFKILLMIDTHDVGQAFLFWIYESSTNQWTTAPMPPLVKGGLRGGLLSKVVFERLLYCCSARSWDDDDMLWSFNFLNGSWEKTGVQFSMDFSARRDLAVIDRDLAVIDNRLFMVKIFQQGFHLLLDINEILLTKKMTRTVTRKNLFKIFPSGVEKPLLPRFRAFGVNKSKLLICGGKGEVAMYNLATRKWERLPQNRLDNFHVDAAIAGRMDYCLPNNPW